MSLSKSYFTSTHIEHLCRPQKATKRDFFKINIRVQQRKETVLRNNTAMMPKLHFTLKKNVWP